MDDIEQIFCCKCLDLSPDRVIFPCGHYVCRKCEDITSCLTCDRPVSLIKETISLECYRKLVSEGSLIPNHKGTHSKKRAPLKKTAAKSSANAKIRKAPVSQKKEKPQKKSSSAKDEAHCLEPTRSSVRLSSKKSENKAGLNGSQSMSVYATPVKEVERNIHPKKARLLNNCLSASKHRIKAESKIEVSLDDILKASPPLKKRKVSIVQPVTETRLKVKKAKRYIDSSDDDDGVFIDSAEVAPRKNTFDVVAQVHADPGFSSASSNDNSLTDEDHLKYTQVGLGHLNQREEDDLSSLMTPVKSPIKDPTSSITQTSQSKHQQTMLTCSSGSSQDFTGFEGDLIDVQDCLDLKDQVPINDENIMHTNDVEDVECLGDESIIISSVPPEEESLQDHLFKTPKAKKAVRNTKLVERDSVHRFTDNIKVTHSHNHIKATAVEPRLSPVSVKFNVEDIESVDAQANNFAKTDTVDGITSEDQAHTRSTMGPGFAEKQSSVYPDDRGKTSKTDKPLLEPQLCAEPLNKLTLHKNKDLPGSSTCDDPPDSLGKTTSNGVFYEDAPGSLVAGKSDPIDDYTITSEDEARELLLSENMEPTDCEIEPEFAEKQSSVYPDDRGKTSKPDKPLLEPQLCAEPLNKLTLHKNKDLPGSSTCDDPPDSLGKTTSNGVFYEDAPGSLVAGKSDPIDDYTITSEDEARELLLSENMEPMDCGIEPEFVEKQSSVYPDDRGKTSKTDKPLLEPQLCAEPLNKLTLHKNKDLPGSSTCDDPPDSLGKTTSNGVFYEDAPGSLVAGKSDPIDDYTITSEDEARELLLSENMEPMDCGIEPEFVEKQSSVYTDDRGKKSETDKPLLEPQPCADNLQMVSNNQTRRGRLGSSTRNSCLPSVVFYEDAPGSLVAENSTANYLENHHVIPSATNMTQSGSLCPQPDAGPLKDVLSQKNETNLLGCLVKTPINSHQLFDEEETDCQAVNVSLSAIVTPPSSTCGKPPGILPVKASNLPSYPFDSSIDSSHDTTSKLLSRTSLMSLSEPRWHSTHQLLMGIFSKVYLPERPKSLIRLAFDALILPLKKDEVFHGLSAISPMTASVEKGVQVELFLEQTTVKVDLGKDPVKRNSFTRRQLSFMTGGSSPSKKPKSSTEQMETEESEDIVEGTPTKAQIVRVNLLNDSTVNDSPLSRTLVCEDSLAQIPVQSVVKKSPRFSIFDPPNKEEMNEVEHSPSQSDCLNLHTSSTKPSTPKTSDLVSPQKQSSKGQKTTVQMQNFNDSRHDSQSMDVSLAYTDSDCIISNSEQISCKRKRRLALPLGGNCNTNQKEDFKPQMNSSSLSRTVSNVKKMTTTGIYDNVEKNAIKKLCGIIKATFSSELTHETTHLILPDGDDVMVTTKFLMALYNGSYVLPMRWVFDCLISKRVLPETDYFFNHPGIHRRMRMLHGASLFENYAFYISSEARKDAVNFKALKDLMKFCNCIIVETVDGILRMASRYKAVVLRGADYIPSPKRIDMSHTEGVNITQVSYQWFYSCLTSYEIQPFDDPIHH